MTANLDQWVGRVLAGRFTHQSRRAFLSRVTRGIFALTGVSLAAEMSPYEAAGQPAAGAGDPNRFDWCGLHGYICRGNCAPTAPGATGRLGNPNSPTYMWVSCCRNPATNRWRCIRYADFCGRRGAAWGQNCEGHRPSGASWCGGAPGSYICTEVAITPQEYATAAACSQGCSPGRPRCEDD